MSEKQANNRSWTSFIAKRYSKDILESVYIQSKLPYHILLQSHTTENDAQCENFKTSENLCWQMCPLSNKCIFLKKDFNTKLWTLFKKNVQCSVKKKNQSIKIFHSWAFLLESPRKRKGRLLTMAIWEAEGSLFWPVTVFIIYQWLITYFYEKHKSHPTWF